MKSKLDFDIKKHIDEDIPSHVERLELYLNDKSLTEDQVELAKFQINALYRSRDVLKKILEYRNKH